MAAKRDYRKLIVSPFKSGVEGFTDIADYFMYHVPGIDSACSGEALPDERAERLLKDMFDVPELKGRARVLKKIQPRSWVKDDLSGYELDFHDSRLLCNRYGNENEFHAVLRHIRNALAHGYLYIFKGQSKKTKEQYVFLIDFDSGKNNVTAKMMVSMTILRKWKSMIETQT